MQQLESLGLDVSQLQQLQQMQTENQDDVETTTEEITAWDEGE